MNNKNEWRLPTVSELHDVFDYEKGEPKIYGFNPYYYWSATPHAYCDSEAWLVLFVDGRTFGYSKTSTNYVRCVRESEDGSLEWSESSKQDMAWFNAVGYCRRMNK